MEPAQIEACVFTVMYSIIMLVSLVGNTLLIYIVWKKPEVRSLTSFMFVNMAVADLLVTLVMMPWSIAFFYTEGKWLIKGAIGEITCRGVIYTANFTVMASILCLTFTALDRFYAVVYPFRRQLWFRKAKFLTPLIWILSVALMSIIPVIYQLHTPSSECGFNVEVWGDEDATIRGVFVYLFVTSYFFPLCATSILYMKTVHNLWFHQAPGNQLIQGQQQRETTKKRVVRNLIIIFTTFALCWLPAQAYTLFIAITAWKVEIPSLVMYLVYWLGHANSAINPWIYMGLNNKMNLQVAGMICRRKSNVEDRLREATADSQITDSLV